MGKERGDRHETGEIKRVVSSLLLQVDALPSYVVIVTASNHPELLDRAVWRRFQVRLEMPIPKPGQIEEWFKRFEKQTGHKLGLSARVLANRLKGSSYSEIEDFGNDVLPADCVEPTRGRRHQHNPTKVASLGQAIRSEPGSRGRERIIKWFSILGQGMNFPSSSSRNHLVPAGPGFPVAGVAPSCLAQADKASG